MKKIKDLHKYIIGFILGIIVIGSVSVYAVEAVINSKEVSYDNKESHGSFTDVQDSIDELYKRSGIMKNKWEDPILNGADPVLGEDMIPVTIDDDGTVHYANLYTKWYEYETKKWANAVILVDSEKGKYKTGDKIPESAIESYFVWIPRYKYKIWDLGNYTSFYNFSDLKDSADLAKNGADTAARRIMASARVIDVVFQKKNEKTSDVSGECKTDPTSGGGKTCNVGEYMTHPAFTLGTTELSGIWVGKFETGYNQTGNGSGPITDTTSWTTNGAERDEEDSNKIIIKPNVYSWRAGTVGNFWRASYNYKRELDSHMMKNTEWGAVAYLSHSVYGIGNEININNNSARLTGYSAAADTDQSSDPGTSGTEDSVTQPWNTSTGYLASTTGNITGVYDMSGGSVKIMAAYMDGYGVTSSLSIDSGLTNSDFETYANYFDKYSKDSTGASYNLRILGDATGEMGPFYLYFDKDEIPKRHNSWYADYSDFVETKWPWFGRGATYLVGELGGGYSFTHHGGGIDVDIGSRLVLAF